MSFLDVNYLTGSNFTNWLKNLKILVKFEYITYILEGDGLVEATLDPFDDELWEYRKW